MRAFLNLQFGSITRSQLKTADGAFTVSGVMPGVEYHVQMMKGKSFFPRTARRSSLIAKPESGKTFDLGTVDVGRLRDDD